MYYGHTLILINWKIMGVKMPPSVLTFGKWLKLSAFCKKREENSVLPETMIATIAKKKMDKTQLW